MWSHLDQLKGMTVMVSVEKFHRGRRSLMSVDFSVPCTAVWCAYTIQPYTLKEKDGGSEWSPSTESHFLWGNVTGCLTRLLPRIQQLSPTFFPGHTSPLPQQTHHLTVSQKKSPFFLKVSFFSGILSATRKETKTAEKLNLKTLPPHNWKIKFLSLHNSSAAWRNALSTLL